MSVDILRKFNKWSTGVKEEKRFRKSNIFSIYFCKSILELAEIRLDAIINLWLLQIMCFSSIVMIFISKELF